MNENNTNNIVKPITVAREDFRKALLNLCNDSGLPIFCIEDLLKDFIQQVHIASVEQYKKDKEDYDKSIKSATKD